MTLAEAIELRDKACNAAYEARQRYKESQQAERKAWSNLLAAERAAEEADEQRRKIASNRG